MQEQYNPFEMEPRPNPLMPELHQNDDATHSGGVVESNPHNLKEMPGINLPSPKDSLKELYGDSTAPHDIRVAEILASSTKEQVSKTLDTAMEYVTEDSHINQFFLGGDFRDESGKLRERRLVTMDVPEMMENSPYLSKVCLKMVPSGTDLEREIATQVAIQNAVDADRTTALRVPRILKGFKHPEKKFNGALMERLPKNEKNNTLQNLIEDAKRNGITLRLSDSATEGVDSMYRELHRLGFLHDDVNEGNVYLTNVEYRDYTLPKVPGKPRPSVLRVIFSADPILMDFERTKPLSSSDKGFAEKEEKAVRSMLEAFELPLELGASLDEVIEASDDFFEDQRGRRAS